MDKLYDFAKAKRLIEIEKQSDLVSADMGILEDWFWTGKNVWNKEQGYLINLDKKNWIAGIDGSCWGTPIIKFYYSDGKEKKCNCWIGGEMERDPSLESLFKEDQK